MIKSFIGWFKEQEQKNKSVFAVVRMAIVIIAVLLGGLFAMGSILAIHFERIGFGTRSGDSYILAVAAGFAASLIIPAILWRLLLPELARWWWISVIVGIGGACVLFGVTL